MEATHARVIPDTNKVHGLPLTSHALTSTNVPTTLTFVVSTLIVLIVLVATHVNVWSVTKRTTGHHPFKTAKVSLAQTPFAFINLQSCAEQSSPA